MVCFSMAKAFTQLKNPKLAPTDKIPFGKYKGCRVCDCWDDYEYFLWLHKEHPGMFTQGCIDGFNSAKACYDKERYQREEVDPYLFDDVPF
jgi:uncharacterized protein (DUF3820 family)